MCSALSNGRRLSSRDKYPCIDFPDGICPKRKPGCQDKCPEMAKAKKENDTRKAIERQKRHEETSLQEFSIQRQMKAQRKKIRER